MSSFSIAELARLGGVSRRTVRYYVQRGLIPSPTGTGRGRHYGQDHLDALLRVKRLQQEGASLQEIVGEKRDSELTQTRTRSALDEARLPAPFRRSSWLRVDVADGIELHVEERCDLDPASLARAVAALRAALTDQSGGFRT